MSHAADEQPNVLDKYNNRIFLFLFNVITIVEMEVRKLRKDPTELIMRGIQPALWLLIFGQAFSRLRVIPTGPVSYQAFLTPGILAQSITFISIFYGIMILWDRDMGILQKIMVTPISRSAFILGKMLSASFRSISQGIIILILSALLGIHLEWSVGTIAGVLFTVIIGGMLFSGLSMIIAALVKTRERMMGMGQVITMPLFFSSSALYPISIMPDWLKILAAVNPMSYLVDGLRNLLIHTAGTHLLLDWSVLIGTTVLIFFLNQILYPRTLS